MKAYQIVFYALNGVVLFLFLLMPSETGASIFFNGKQYAYTASNLNLKISHRKVLSMAAWVDLPAGLDTAYYGRIFSKVGSNSNNQTFNLGIQDCSKNGGTAGRLCAIVGMDNSIQNIYLTIYMADSKIPLSGRHHIAFTWKNIKGELSDFVFYVDGQAQATPSQTIGIGRYSKAFSLEDVIAPFYLGAACGDTCPSEFTQGNIADIAVWNVPLNPKEIAVLYNGGVAAPCLRIPKTIQASSLMIYFPLDDSTGGLVTANPIQLGSSPLVVDSYGNNPTWSSDLECSAH